MFAIFLGHQQGIEGDAHILPAEAEKRRWTLPLEVAASGLRDLSASSSSSSSYWPCWVGG